MGVLMMMALEKVKRSVFVALIVLIFAILTLFSDWQVYALSLFGDFTKIIKSLMASARWLSLPFW